MKRSIPDSAPIAEPVIHSGFVAKIPNLLSLLRLLASPVLLLLVISHQDRPFRWLLVFCLLSDIADGLIARIWNVQSKIGALLDSTADILVSGIAVFALFTFRGEFLSGHFGPMLTIIALYLIALAGAFFRYGKPASFHTIACRIAAYAQGIFVVLLFFHGYQPFLFYLMIGISTVAYIEEIVLLCMLSSWTSDVGGVYWVIRNGNS
jgi:CDP-diacylglycerol--glycerol-3-phosphate 3-phosphatidyltransferase